MSARRLILFFDPVSTPLNNFKEWGCPSQIGGNHGNHIQYIYIYIYIYIYTYTYIYMYMSNLKTLGSRNGHPQLWKGPNRLPHVCTKMIYGKLGGYRLQENLYNELKWSTWLQSGGCASFLIRHLRCRTLSYLRRCYWKRCFANLFFPTASIYGQLIGQPPLHSYSIASSPALLAYKPECFGACQLSGTLQARTFARKMSDRLPVYLYLPFCLSAYLAS